MLNKSRLLTPGPTPIPSRVRLAMAQEMIHHRKSNFKDILRDIQPKLQTLFGTQGPVLPLSVSGTGAMTAAIHGLFAPGEKILVLEAGKFGERWVEIGQTHGCKVQVISASWGETFDIDAVKQALLADPEIRGICMQLSETSTGVLHPVDEIAALTRTSNTLLVVDGISAVGISPCPMDALGIDCLLTGSQKGLMVPPGLALLAMSDRAWQKAAHVKQHCFYFNLVKERENLEKAQTLFTSPVSLIMGLQESLNMLFENDANLENLYRKQWAMTLMTRKGIEALGLSPFVQKHFAWGLTSLMLPDHIDASKISQYMAEKYNIIVAGGQGHAKGRMLRIGHMGYVDFADILAGLHALAQAMHVVAHAPLPLSNYLEQALEAYEAGLQMKPGTTI